MNPRDDPGYPGEAVRLDAPATRPSYSTLLDWVRMLPDQKAVTFDFWARGNFTRRIIFNRANGIHPLVVRVSNLDELRAAYRRLVLLGAPADFVYSGMEIWTGRTLSLIPIDMAPDAGWGYMCAAGSQTVIRGKEYAPIFGHGTYLPDDVVSWLLTEAEKGFQTGQFMVAPAPSVGIRSTIVDGRYTQLAGVADGLPLINRMQAAKAMVSLELPRLDDLSPGQFDAFLAEHTSEVRELRSAFGELTEPLHDGEQNIGDVVKGLRNQVAEMQELVRQGRMRIGLSGAGASASVASFTISIAQGLDPAAVGGAASAAALALGDLYLQARERAKGPPAHRLALLWRLGIRSPGAVRQPPVRAPPSGRETGKPTRGFHWLCPPTPGMLIPTVRVENITPEPASAKDQGVHTAAVQSNGPA